jgi:hypothetical protein
LSLELNPSATTILVSDTITAANAVKLTLSAKAVNAPIQTPKGVEWTSSDTAVAIVDSLGTVKPRRVGTATITARVNSARANTEVTVAWRATKLVVTPTALSGLVRDTVVVSALALDADDKSVPGAIYTFTVADPTAATVTKTGNQTARIVFLKAGNVQVNLVAVGQQSSLSGVIQPREFISSPVAGAPPGSQILSAGADATCGLLPLGRGYCFGRAPLLGVAKDTSCFGDSPSSLTPCTLVPLRIAGQLNFVSVTVGETVACGATADGRAYCWGEQTFGQLGNGISSGGSSLTPALVVGAVVSNAFLLSRVTAGGFHACGLNASGSAFCWGQDSVFQLANGDGKTVNSTTPIPVAGGFAFTTLSAGSKHTCGLRADAAVMCWGDNRRGQLGTPTTPDTASDTPVLVSGTYSQISAGRFHTCALTPTGAAFCWGNNTNGQLGRGTPDSSVTPVAVAGGLTFRSISAGATNTCGITTGGAAYCWGANDWGQLGNGNRGVSVNAPVAVTGGRTDFVAVAVGIRHVCAIASSGTYCWGSNIFGALGNEFQAVVQLTPTKTATPQ